MYAVVRGVGVLHAAMKIIDSGIGFKYQQVEALPPGADQWHAYAKSILEKSRPDLNLTIEQEKAVLAADNGDWTKQDMTHWCLPDCPLGCGGNASKSKQIFKDAVTMSVCCRMYKPLMYRWKGFESANATCLRGRKQHDILGRALAATWPAKVLKDAQARAAAHETNDGEELPFAVTNAIRASAVGTVPWALFG